MRENKGPKVQVVYQEIHKGGSIIQGASQTTKTKSFVQYNHKGFQGADRTSSSDSEAKHPSTGENTQEADRGPSSGNVSQEAWQVADEGRDNEV